METTRPDRTAREIQARVADGSAHPFEYCSLADFQIAAGDWTAAIASLDQALHLRLDNFQRAVILVEKAGTVKEIGDGERASALAVEAVDLLAREGESPDISLYRGLAHGLIAHCMSRQSPAYLDEAQAATRFLEKAVRDEGDPDAPIMKRALFEAARSYQLLGNSQRAIEYGRRCLALGGLNDQERLDILIVLGVGLRSAGQLTEAQEVFEEMRRYLSPAMEPRFYMELGLLLRDLDRPGDAYDTFEQCRRSLTAHDRLKGDILFTRAVYLELAESAYRCGHRKRAAAAYEKALDLTPKDDSLRPGILMWIAKCEGEDRQFAEARDRLMQVLKSDLASDSERQAAATFLSDVHIALARSHVESGLYSKAAREYKDALPLGPGTDDEGRAAVLLFLGDAFMKNGFDEIAQSCYKNALDQPGANEEQREKAKECLAALHRRRT
jgi:tetratricopeptide (TPR) repeat protein